MTRLLRVSIALALCYATPALAHGGGLNACGCHIKHATDECHCHRPNGNCACACNGCGRVESLTPAACSRDDTALILVPAGSTRVKGHTTKKGTYVMPHRRTRPNTTKLDNYSTRGNVNPSTGKKGTKKL